jgi:hypothetical protein
VNDRHPWADCARASTSSGISPFSVLTVVGQSNAFTGLLIFQDSLNSLPLALTNSVASYQPFGLELTHQQGLRTSG